MTWAASAVNAVVRHFTTEPAVRAGVVTAGWAVAASYARGLLPRSPVQQAAVTGSVVAAHYAIGATTWSGITSTAAGLPGSRAGNQALLTAAAVTAIGGRAMETAAYPHAGDSLLWATAWSEFKLLSVVGLAGGMVTATDVVAHKYLGLPRTPTTTLALDLTAATALAGGTLLRRRLRTTKYRSPDNPEHPVLSHEGEDAERGKDGLAKRARTWSYVAGTVTGTSVGLGLLAVLEQALANQVRRGLNAAVGEDLGDLGTASAHGVTFLGFAGAGYLGLRTVRQRAERRSVDIEPAYMDSPTDAYVSAGPASSVAFESIGKEGRRFVTMRLSREEIETVVGEEAIEPVRIVIPKDGSVDDRAALAVRELIATGGIDRSLICIASPTGVGYVNYIMAEALEYLTRGDCAIVVPQYAYVPSALALNKTDEATQLQTVVIKEVLDEVRRRGSPARVVQFGESLGAQVAADVGGASGVAGFDQVGVQSGVYMGVPFRSALWREYLDDPDAMTSSGRLVVTASSEDLGPGPDRHVLVIHDDDPITKFGYTMVVQPPWWFGPPETRPPKVPRETRFRPITSFVLALVDLLNGMNMKPGEFHRVGHDYRIDMRGSLQQTFGLPATPVQERRIEEALRAREEEWAVTRLIAKTGDKALRNLRTTLDSWGQGSVNIELGELPRETQASNRLLDYLNGRLGTGGER